ncbi:MAG: peptide chain release factor 1 [Bacilli bacterium]|nr:peptide chain release factor 1 [Bacilli bacterium]
MFERLDLIEERYNQINELLQDPSIISNVNKMTSLMKEQRSIEKTVNKYREYKEIVKTIADLKEMSKDKDVEIAEMAKMELEEVQGKDEALIEELKILLLPKDENDEKNVIVEIRGAAGGEEGNIFAADLFRMYSKYAESKGWKIEVMDSNETGLGGYSLIQFSVSGDAVYSYLKFESGSHRVQRVPVTEANGRIQTSTATVLVMPEAEETEVELKMEDVRIDIFCASGPGGQCVNTTKSAIRVTHIPTGIVVSCQDGKNQHENKANALKILKARLYDKIMEDKAKEEGIERMAKIGHGDRSEKIRTYNYPQNRVTDHRIGFTIQQLDRVMEGKLDPVIDALMQEEQRRLLAGEESKLSK